MWSEKLALRKCQLTLKFKDLCWNMSEVCTAPRTVQVADVEGYTLNFYWWIWPSFHGDFVCSMLLLCNTDTKFFNCLCISLLTRVSHLLLLSTATNGSVPGFTISQADASLIATFLPLHWSLLIQRCFIFADFSKESNWNTWVGNFRGTLPRRLQTTVKRWNECTEP